MASNENAVDADQIDFANADSGMLGKTVKLFEVQSFLSSTTHLKEKISRRQIAIP